MLSLTERQKKLWNFIHQHRDQHGSTPRLTDMVRYLQTSNRAALDILRGLEKKGYIVMPQGTHSIKLLRTKNVDFTPLSELILNPTNKRPIFASTSNLNSTDFYKGEVNLIILTGMEANRT